MTALTWGDALACVEQGLERRRSTQAIVKELCSLAALSIVESIDIVFTLLPVCDHLDARDRYDRLRLDFERLRNEDDWMVMRIRNRSKIPMMETLR